MSDAIKGVILNRLSWNGNTVKLAVKDQVNRTKTLVRVWLCKMAAPICDATVGVFAFYSHPA